MSDRLERGRRRMRDASDVERLEYLFRAADRIVRGSIEDELGELSPAQRRALVGILAGLALCIVDLWHPRPDGRRWQEVFHELMRGA